MLLIKNANIYDPRFIGTKNLLIGAGKILSIGDQISNKWIESESYIIDAKQKYLIPGIIDRHVHIIGGGGEGGFSSFAPPVQLSALLKGGVTTVVGVLGTDGVTKTIEQLLAKAKGLKEEGISSYICSGSYGIPSITLTGSIKKDIIFINEILGVKLALSDHRSSHVTLNELIRLASDVRMAGLISGKNACIHLHMGDEDNALQLVGEILSKTSLPITLFHPTHVGRNPKLQNEAFLFAKKGGTIDFTCGQNNIKQEILSISLKKAKQEGVPMEKITISSDGQGSWSIYNINGALQKIGISDVDTVLKQIQFEVMNGFMSLTEAISLATLNVAKALGLYPNKGCIQQGSDADLLILNTDLTLDTVIANGKIMVKEGKILQKGVYENE